MKRQDVFGPMRPPFLLLPPVCVALGASTAVWTGSRINFLHLLLIFVGALAAHISVNALNEYFDFRSGLDLRTQPTPFSGGSGTLPARPQAAGLALTTSLVSLGIAAVIGIYFLFVRGLGLLPLGLLGLAVIVAYTPWLTRNPLLCLVAPGLGFGTFMVMGTDFCLSGSYSWPAFFASLVPFFLVCNLLLLNQFPDVEADRAVGRRHLLIVAGPRTSSLVYAAMLLGTYLSIVVGWILGILPAWALLGLLTLPLALQAARGAYQYGGQIERLVPYLGQNVLVTLLTPLLVAIGLFLATWL
jgi:1,4-dihydroxy-2-naphthoate octaprenyltransferase